MEYCEIPRWQVLKQDLNNLSYADFVKDASANKQAVLLDARTPQEFDAGHLTGAINVNYLSEHLADELEALDKDKHYYIYCRTSRRSLRVCVLLKNMGFKQIYHLENGLIEQEQLYSLAKKTGCV